MIYFHHRVASGADLLTAHFKILYTFVKTLLCYIHHRVNQNLYLCHFVINDLHNITVL